MEALTAVPAGGPRFAESLGVVGSPPHWTGPDGTPCAYEPYVREMRVWADLVGQVEVCGPSGEGPHRGNLAPYDRPNLRWHGIAYATADGLRGQLARLRQFPRMVWAVFDTIRRHDLVLLRSPGHLSLVGAVLVRLLRRPSLTKWAGENGAYPGERLPSRLQRWIEGIPDRRNAVLVYGPSRRPHQISFLPALMNAAELARARDLSAARPPPPPWEILSVGRLDSIKGFDLALKGLARLRREHPDLDWSFRLVGDGPERTTLEDLAREGGIGDRVRFEGSLPFCDAMERYAAAHVVIMPGTREGWPKPIVEAWAHGSLPVAAAAGLVPWIMREPGSGVLFEPTPEALSSALSGLLASPASFPDAAALREKAVRLSLESFRDRLADILIRWYGLDAVRDGTRGTG